MPDELERYQQQHPNVQPWGGPPSYQQHQNVQPYGGPPGYQPFPSQPPYPAPPYHGAHAYQPVPLPTAPPKSPGVAVILSLLITGLGHLYTGNPIAAICWFAGAVFAGALIFLGVGLVLLPCVWVGAAVHAYVAASDYNRRHHAIR